MSSDPVRLGLIGAGVFANRAWAPALRDLGDTFDLVAVCNRTRSKAESLAAQFGDDVRVHTSIDELLACDDVEAVAVVLPILAIPDVVERAFAAGKHVVSEKPIAPTVARGWKTARVHDRYPHLVWMVAEQWRYERRFVLAAEMVREGRIGTPILADWAVHVAVRPGHAYHGTEWRRTGEVPGGFLLDAGVHYAAVLRMLLGEVTEVHAVTTGVHADLPPADTLTASLRFDSGALASLSMTFAASTPWPFALRVVGAEGALRVLPDAVEVSTPSGITTEPVAPYTGIVDELAAFARSVRHGEPHVNTSGQALADLAVLEAILRSSESGACTRP